jgi:flagellar basal-body rod protein FlgF
MENTIYLGLARQMVLKDNMDIIANNVANVNTPGYRAQNLLFAEHITKERGDIDPMSFVYDKGEYKNTLPGPVKVTGNPLDVSVEGPGFFGVVGPDGKTYYTRAGNFTMDANGALYTQSGHPVADAGGSPITIPTNSTEINIDDAGVISNQEGQVGQLMVVEFQDPQQLKPYGDNMYASAEQPIPSTTSVVKQGQLEGSNVLAVTEITRMIDTLRNFQSMQNILTSENERLRTAIQRLTRQS